MAVGGMGAEKEEQGGKITPEPVSVWICAHTIHPVRQWVLRCLPELCGKGLGITGRKNRGFPTFCAAEG